MADRRPDPDRIGPVCGIDEAGRGPWAGPVIAAAVILPARLPAILSTLDDSKKLSAPRRITLLAALRDSGAFLGVGEASVAEIDRLNILAATHLAMARAVAALPVRPGHALVDGNRLPVLPCPATAVVHGDSVCPAISAASIVAKVTRDAVMEDLDDAHPGYGWARNKGYGTAEHAAALARLGITLHHRTSFSPVRRAMGA